MVVQDHQHLVRVKEFGGWDSGFGVQGPGFLSIIWFEFRRDGLRCRLQGSKVCTLKIHSAGCRVEGSGFIVQGSGIRFQGVGCAVQGPGLRVTASD